MAANQLDQLADKILACEEEGCRYKGSLAATVFAGKKKPKWLYWGSNPFFPPLAAPPGVAMYVPFAYNGDARVVLVAFRPSTGGYSSFPDEGLALFAETLYENHELAKPVFRMVDNNTWVYYEGVLVTDVIKCRGRVADKVHEVPQDCRNFLKQELRIVDSHNIVAVGRAARDKIWEIQKDIGFENRFPTPEDVPCVPHYAWGVRPPNTARFKKEFSLVLAKLGLR